MDKVGTRKKRRSGGAVVHEANCLPSHALPSQKRVNSCSCAESTACRLHGVGDQAICHAKTPTHHSNNNRTRPLRANRPGGRRPRARGSGYRGRVRYVRAVRRARAGGRRGRRRGAGLFAEGVT